VEVTVNGKSNIEMAIRSFRKKTQKEGLVKEARRRKAHEKPSEMVKRKKEESISRKKKAKRGEYSF